MPDEIRISDFMFSPDAEPPAEPAPEEFPRLGQTAREFQDKVTNAERNWQEALQGRPHIHTTENRLPPELRPFSMNAANRPVDRQQFLAALSASDMPVTASEMLRGSERAWVHNGQIYVPPEVAEELDQFDRDREEAAPVRPSLQGSALDVTYIDEVASPVHWGADTTVADPRRDIENARRYILESYSNPRPLGRVRWSTMMDPANFGRSEEEEFEVSLDPETDESRPLRVNVRPRQLDREISSFRWRGEALYPTRVDSSFLDDDAGERAAVASETLQRAHQEINEMLFQFEAFPMRGLSQSFLRAILPSILLDTVHGGLSYYPIHNIIVRSNSEEDRRIPVDVGWQAEAFLLYSALSRVYSATVSNDPGTAARILRGHSCPTEMIQRIFHIVKSLVAIQRFPGLRQNLLFGETTVRHGTNSRREGGMKFQVEFADAADLS